MGAASDTITESAALNTLTNQRAASGIAFAAAINAVSADTGVTATANQVQTIGTVTTVNSGTTDGLKSIFVNGYEVKVEFKTTQTASERVQAVLAAVNPQVGATGVVATANPQGGMELDLDKLSQHDILDLPERIPVAEVKAT